MKKSLFLTLLLALLCTVTTWAQTVVTDLGSLSNDKAYVFYSSRSPLYFDSNNRVGSYWTTQGMEEQGSQLDVTSSEQAFALIRTEYTEAGKYYMYSIKGQKFVGSNNVASDTPTAVATLASVTYNGNTCFNLSIDGQKVNVTWWTNNAPGIRLNSGASLDEGNALTLYEANIADLDLSSVVAAVEEYEGVDTDPYVLLKAPTTGNYLSFTLPNTTSTQVSFQATGTKLVLENSSDGTGYYIKQKDSDPAVYLTKSSSNNWDVTTSTTPYTWLISDADANGYVTISHVNGNLGHNTNQNVGTGIFANVDAGCNKWLIEEYNAGVVEYTFAIDNTTGEEVSATYNGAAIAAGGTIEIEGTVDTSLFAATDVEGYAWSVVVNSSAKTITIVYVEKYNGSYYLKSSTGSTYLNLTPCSTTSTGATFQLTGTEFYIEPIGDNYYITQLNSNPIKYFTVSSSNAWDVTTSTTAYEWLIKADANGYVTITKVSEASHCLGNNTNQNIGTGVYANVVSSCNTWQLVKVGPLDYTFAISNPTGEAVSATYNGNSITDGATVSIDGRVDTSLFSANEIEGYSWNVELDPDTRIITLVYEKKYNWSIVNLPNGATITYNNNAVADGGVVGVDYDSKYLAVTNCPDGYTWEIARDDENKIVTITFTQLQGAENPQAVVDLINRIGGAGTSDKFQFELDPSLNYANEVFVISGDGNKVLIKGTTISAITTGIGWYLQNIARINIAWNSLNEKTVSGDAYADLSNIPLNVPEETHTSDAMYRYYLNTCAFGYSMTSWTWKRWQQEIDWMALHGINMPLQLVGMEEVWRKFLTMEDEEGRRKYGYDDASAKAFVAGPAFIAWWAMNNLEGWGGTAPGTKSGFNNLAGAGGVQDDAWYVRQKTLAKQICDRQRELGMQPVIPGWSGMVPTNFASKSGYATRSNGGNWAGDFVRPLLLNVSNANYGEIAADYYKCLHEVMGESQYYSMDPFHEGGGAGTMEDYEAMYAAMEAAKPGSQWVIQQWQWSATQRYSLTAVPAGRLVVLDLFADGSPAFDSYNGFAPQDAVFSTIPNFGGRSGLMGRLTNLTDNYFKFKARYASIKGIGAAPEAIEQTPVTYDLIFQLPWMNGVKPDVAEWVSNYAIARYGQDNEEIKEAWSLLRQGPLNYGADAIQGPVEDVWAAKPNLTANKASEWGKTMKDAIGTYTKARHQMLIDATYKLLGQKDAITGDVYLSNYYYDLVEFGGGVLADYAYYLLLGIGEARNASNTELYEARRDAFLQLILDVDAFKGTNLNFRLGKWTQEARDAAGEVVNPTTATADWYEYNNARTIVSTWSSPGTNLNDYSYRSWQGLLKDLYYPRWKHYFDNNCTSANYNYFAWNWAHGMVHEVGQTSISSTPLTSGQTGHTDTYTRAPEGNTVEKATEVLGKYIVPVKLADGSTYYAYRCLSNELNLTLTTTEGATLNLSEYITFGNLDGVTMSITSNLIDGNTTDLSAVAIKADACGGADSATDIVTVALSDGTTLTLTVVVNTSAMMAAKEELAALIEEMEELAPQVATYNPVGKLTEVTLATTQGSNGYIWTNAQSSQEGPIAGLIDGNTGTYLHTDYSGGSVTSGTHYIAVDLGADYKIGKFTFDYTTRSGASNDFPDGITVYGSDDNSNYKKIAEITEPAFPQSANTKWELGKNLYSEMRYLRFNVLAERGYWHMSEFNIYQTASTAEVVDKYSEVIGNDFAATQYDVLVDAKNTYDYGETLEETANAVTALQNAIEALKEKMALVPEESPEHPELTALIGNFEELIGKIAEVESTVSNNIPLQVDNSNAEGYIYSNATIAEGTLNNLLDDDNNSYIHTAWSGNTADGLNHYLRVYLGENPSLSDFTFSYVTRNNSNTEKPKQITVAGCATVDGEYTTIATITGLPSASATTFNSDTYNAAGYKYLRFMVDDTYRDLTDGNGHKAYSMAKLVITDCVNTYTKVDVAFKDADYTTLRGITNAGVAADYKALQAAIATNASGTADEKETTYQSLKALYDALVAKLQYMDEGVYNINFGGNPVFVGYSTDTSGNDNTAGYKLIDPTSGHITDVAQADALFTITHNGVGYSLSAQGKYLKNPHTNGWHHIMFSDDKAEEGRYMFDEVETGVYKLLSAVVNNNQANYVNDYGNVFGNDKKGIASSTFTLTQVTEYSLTMPEGGITTLCLPFNVTLPAGVTAYDIVTVAQDAVAGRYEYTLELLASEGETIAKNTPVVVKGTADEVYALAITMSDENVKTALTGSVLRGTFVKTTIGTDVANYTLVVTDGEATFNIVSAADTPVPANSCWMELTENRGTIIYDSEAQDPVIEPIEIVDGGVYRLHGRLLNGALRTLYTNGSNNRILWTSVEKSDSLTLFIAQKNEETGKYRLVSALANGIWSQDATLTETGVELDILNGSVNGTAMILGDNKRRFCVDSDNLDYFSNAGDDPASAYVNDNVTTDFVFELVEDATISYTLKMGTGYAYATLYLPYAVTVPDGVTAYVAGTPADNRIPLTEVNTVIPANEPVILYRETATSTENFVFEYTTEAPADVNDNILTGKLIETLVEGVANTRYYMLMKYNDREKFFWILKEYDSTGKLYTGVTKENQQTHIKCSANKAFLEMSELQASSSYSFQLPGTTGIDEIETEGVESDAIYDLHGRKIIEPVKGSIYIKNGKVFIAK